MFGFIRKSTHEAELERHGATITKLAAEKRTVETLLSRIARRDTRIATLETDKAAVESELRLVNEANASLRKRIAELEKPVSITKAKSAPKAVAKVPVKGKVEAKTGKVAK